MRPAPAVGQYWMVKSFLPINNPGLYQIAVVKSARGIKEMVEAQSLPTRVMGHRVGEFIDNDLIMTKLRQASGWEPVGLSILENPKIWTYVADELTRNACAVCDKRWWGKLHFICPECR